MAEVVILGAGITGLSTAYHLEQLGFYDYKIFEKDATVGGLCRSIKQDGFTFDFTGHLLHIGDPVFKSFIERITGLECFNTIKRESFIYSHERYTRYPYQVNLWGLPPAIITECIEQYATRAQDKNYKKKSKNFYQWVLKKFGSGFGKHFFFPYQQKIFDYPVTRLTDSWTGRFVPDTSLQAMIQGALQDNHEQDIGYNARFFYPKEGGIFFWVEKLYQNLINPVSTNHSVKAINLKEKRVIFTNGTSEQYKHLVSTLPLDLFLSKLSEQSSSSLKSAARSLRCNSVLNYNIGVARENIEGTPHKHWIYFPEKQYPFYRLGFPHNFSAKTVPAGCSSLYGEVSYLNRSNSHRQQLIESARQATYKLFAIDKSEVITEKIITIDHAYVIYNAWRDKNIPSLLAKLKEQTVHSIGRYGAWKYASMQEGILDGKQCAEELSARLELAAHSHLSSVSSTRLEF